MESRAAEVKVACLASDESGLSRAVIRVNGRPLQGKGLTVSPTESAAGHPQELKVEQIVPLTEGLNRVTIEAVDIDGLTTEKTIEVTLVRVIPEIWAAVVGISRYVKVRNLKYAAGDAQAFSRYLSSDLGVPQDHVFVLLDAEATTENVRRLWGETIRQKAGREDQVIFFFSGHGAVEDDPSSPDGDGLMKYLLTHNSDITSLFSSAIPMDEVARIFSRLASDKIVLIADTCYSGGAGGKTVLAKDRKAVISDSFLSRLVQGKGRNILTASGANETSFEDDAIRHGFFTFHLLQALRGKADNDRDGLITIIEAYDYLSRVVPEATGQRQHPVLKGDIENPIILGKTGGE